MKLSIYIFLFIFIFGCNENDEKLNEETQTDTVVPGPSEARHEPDTIKSTDTDSVKKISNITDKHGFKQGTWIKKNWKGVIISIENYTNDTLNGYWYSWNGMQREGRYKNGKREGYFRTYYGDMKDEKVMSVEFYLNDTLEWIGFPAADEKHIIPNKGFGIRDDSTYVKAPYLNGNIWYEGLFIKYGTPVGIHKVFRRNGKLKAIVNYSDSTIKTYDSLGVHSNSTSILEYLKTR